MPGLVELTVTASEAVSARYAEISAVTGFPVNSARVLAPLSPSTNDEDFSWSNVVTLTVTSW